MQDDELFVLLSMLIDFENIKLEPSAAAGISGVIKMFNTEEATQYLRVNKLTDKMGNASLMAWATGGSMVPKDVMEAYYKKGKQLLSNLDSFIK